MREVPLFAMVPRSQHNAHYYHGELLYEKCGHYCQNSTVHPLLKIWSNPGGPWTIMSILGPKYQLLPVRREGPIWRHPHHDQQFPMLLPSPLAVFENGGQGLINNDPNRWRRLHPAIKMWPVFSHQMACHIWWALIKAELILCKRSNGGQRPWSVLPARRQRDSLLFYGVPTWSSWQDNDGRSSGSVIIRVGPNSECMRSGTVDKSVHNASDDISLHNGIHTNVPHRHKDHTSFWITYPHQRGRKGQGRLHWEDGSFHAAAKAALSLWFLLPVLFPDETREILSSWGRKSNSEINAVYRLVKGTIQARASRWWAYQSSSRFKLAVSHKLFSPSHDSLYVSTRKRLRKDFN